MLAVIVSSSVHCDMAFMTTCRHPVFTAAPGAGRADHAGGVRGFRREAGRFNGETNHVHLLVDFPPLVWLSPAWTAASRGMSSRRLRQEFPDQARHYWRANRLWSGSYFAGSAGGAPISVLRQYIEQQDRPA
jgi:putative transposase